MSDSGAQANCFPQRIIDANPQIVTRITPAPPRTALVFGNNQSQSTTQIAHIGDSEALELSWHTLHSDAGPLLLGVWYRPPRRGETASIAAFDAELQKSSWVT